LMGAGDLSEWGICGVGLREADRKMCGVLKKQDCLYTLIVKHPGGKVENRVIGSLVDFLTGCFVADAKDSVGKRIGSQTLRTVGLPGGPNLQDESPNSHPNENPQEVDFLPHFVWRFFSSAREATAAAPGTDQPTFPRPTD
jgi:mannitol-1-phosphate/altronate dehydrogenase